MPLTTSPSQYLISWSPWFGALLGALLLLIPIVLLLRMFYPRLQRHLLWLTPAIVAAGLWAVVGSQILTFPDTTSRLAGYFAVLVGTVALGLAPALAVRWVATNRPTWGFIRSWGLSGAALLVMTLLTMACFAMITWVVVKVR